MWLWIRCRWLPLTILTLLVLTAYAPFLGNDFVSDDLPTILHNPDIGKFQAVIAHGFGIARPFFYYLAYHLGGLNPAAFRLINLVSHLGSVILIFALISKLHSNRLGFLAAALFALHPLLSEPVIWISGGAYPQATFFLLAAFLSYLYARQNFKLYLLALILFLFGLMSQALPLILPGILLFYELTFGSWQANWKKLIPFFIFSLLGPLVGAAGVSFSQIPERTQTIQQVHYQQVGLVNPFVAIPTAVTNYLQLILWPQDLTLYHSELSSSLPVFILRGLITLGLLVATGYLFFKNRVLSFWLGLFFIGLIPTLIPATFGLVWIVAERYVYFSTLGIIMVILLLSQRFLENQKYRQLSYAVFLGVLVLLLIRTVVRNNDWRNEDNLWVATGKTSPSSPNTHNNLGDVYGRHGDKQAALREFQKAIELKPNYADAYHNLANTYHELGQDDLALANYQKAVEISPILWQSYQNIAAIYFQRGDLPQALNNLQRALQISPNNPSLKTSLGIVYLKLNRKSEAKQAFMEALTLDPSNQLAQQGYQEASK